MNSTKIADIEKITSHPELGKQIYANVVQPHENEVMAIAQRYHFEINSTVLAAIAGMPELMLLGHGVTVVLESMISVGMAVALHARDEPDLG